MVTHAAAAEEGRGALPSRVGIDARMLAPRPTGVGNYIAGLLLPLCRRYPSTRFFLYSNGRIEFAPLANVTIREGGMRVGPAWLNLQLPRTLASDGIEVFWGANGVAPVLGARPTVVTVHDLVYRFAGSTMTRGARWTKRLFQGWSVRRARHVIAVSAATAADVHATYGRRVDAVIEPIAHAVFHRRDAEAMSLARASHGLSEPFWLFAGTLEPRKNLVNLLGAYIGLVEQGESMPTLALAGAAGWGEPRLNELIRQGEASGCVRRLGYVSTDDLACLYSACEVLWMPSLYEGFGMPLLEAQRCGAPVVHGPHASMVEASGGLGVVSGTDESSLAATLRSIARGGAPLTCRIFDCPAGAAQAEISSHGLWRLLSQAASTAGT